MALIYKYRNWESFYQRRFVTNNEVFFASPKSLNDPLELINIFRYENLSNENKLLFISEVISNTEYWKSDGQIITDAQEWLEKDRLNNYEQLKRHGRRITRQLRKKIGIFSSSNTGDNHHMWLNYANNYKGFCIGYDFDTLREYLSSKGVGGFGGNVQYVDELPDIIPDIQDKVMDIFKLSITKLKKWELEDENRIAKFQFVNDKISIRSSIIKEIIIGEEIEESAKKDLFKHVYRKYKDCKVLIAKRPISTENNQANLEEI